MTSTGSRLDHLECPQCRTTVAADRLATTCPTCAQALFAVYRTSDWSAADWRTSLAERPATLWRYRELLPVRESASIVSLGEGFSPVLSLGAISEAPPIDLWLKDDGGLPTGSFKARGMAAAVSRARELGVRAFFVPSAGNAAVALAAYAARAAVRARVYLPESTPAPMVGACRRYGATVVQVPGTIREAGVAARAAEASQGAFDLSTLREPYRAEGKKTMGLEIWEQFGDDRMPEAIVYPTGGGTGLIGMFRAFAQLRELGGMERFPRLYAVQPDGCAPVVKAWNDGAPRAEPFPDPHTIAPGLLVPAPFSSERILEALRGTGGGALSVPDSEISRAVERLASRHGISASPEGAATYAAVRPLWERGWIRDGERVLLYNTGSGIPFL